METALPATAVAKNPTPAAPPPLPAGAVDDVQQMASDAAAAAQASPGDQALAALKNIENLLSQLVTLNTGQSPEAEAPVPDEAAGPAAPPAPHPTPRPVPSGANPA